jgi:hypothetical protein
MYKTNDPDTYISSSSRGNTAAHSEESLGQSCFLTKIQLNTGASVQNCYRELVLNKVFKSSNKPSCYFANPPSEQS